MRLTSRSSTFLCLLPLLLLAGCADEPQARAPARVLLLGFDGLDPEAVDRLVSEGRLPHFSSLTAEGASGRLRSQHPLLSPIVWTTIATGRSPLDHRVSGFVTTGANGEELPVTSRQRQTRALWNIVSDVGREVGVVGWWATWPAEPVNGAIVSDRTTLHFLLADQSGADESLPRITHPAELIDDLRALLVQPDDISFEELSDYAQIDRDAFDRPFDFDDDLSHLKWAIAAARTNAEIGLEVWRSVAPDLLMVYFEATDTAGHLFGHLYRRDDLVGELAEQQARFGGAVDAVYRLADEILGHYLDVIDANTTLLVVSDHGFELGSLHEDPSRTRDMRRVTHENHRLDGVIFAYGAGVPNGRRIGSAGILDVAPTVLALLGLPASEEMPGRVIADAMRSRSPLARVASYESSGQPGSSGDQETAATDEALLDKLRSLGYLNSAETGAVDRNLASMALLEGRYQEAARGFKKLLQEEPDDPELHTALGSALMALERFAAALSELEAALDIDAAYAPAYFVRGQIHERQGNREQAIADYRTAVRYDTTHEKALGALSRLGVAAQAQVAGTAAEVEAAGLLRQAKAALERGDYALGLALVERAQSLVPDAAVVYQYLSNFHYLMGNRQEAIEALERALELEPDNALLRKNLSALRRAEAEDADGATKESDKQRPLR